MKQVCALVKTILNHNVLCLDFLNVYCIDSFHAKFGNTPAQ